MQPVTIQKEYAERVFASIVDGDPIEPQDAGGFAGSDLLTIAGACFYAIMSKGPGFGLPQPDLAPDQAMQAAKEHVDELASAVIFVSGVFDVLARGVYDACYEERMRCLVVGPPGDAKIQPVAGWKTHD